MSQVAEALFAAIANEFGTPVDSLRASYREIAAGQPDELARIKLLLNRHPMISAGQASHILRIYPRAMEKARFNRLRERAQRHLLAAVEAGNDHRAVRASRLLQAIVRRSEAALEGARETSH